MARAFRSTVGWHFSDTPARRLTEWHQKAGQIHLGVPVFGRPEAAASGQLFLVAAGAASALATCQPLFDRLGQKTFLMGETPRDAHLMKIAGNFMLQSAVETMAEAFALLKKSNVNSGKFLDLMTSTLFDSPVYKNYGQMIVSQKFVQEQGFKMPLAFKDLNLTLEAARDAQVPMPTATTLYNQFLTALGRGGKNWDLCGLGKVSEDNAGLSS